MSLQRLRRVLEASYRVRVESSDALVARVNAEVEKRKSKLTGKGVPIPESKAGTVVGAFRPSAEWSIRAIDLLHKIGFLTTPSWTNMARLSASWATRRYFWSIAEPEGPSDFRLSDDARRMDFHQKTLLSDEFGIGMAGLLMESFFGASAFADISVALNDPTMYQDIRRDGGTQPDYLMWSDDPGTPYYVVECKGTQSNEGESYHQLRRGLEQVPSVVFGAGPRQVATFVIATCLMKSTTKVFVLDPPPDEPDDEHSKRESLERVSERRGTRGWIIRNSEAFQRRTAITEGANLLKWAGQYRTAAARDQRLEHPPFDATPVEDAPLETKTTEVGTFRGFERSLFPELGIRNLTIFTGVLEDVLDSLIHPPTVEGADFARPVVHRQNLDRLPSDTSVALNGACMIVQGALG